MSTPAPFADSPTDRPSLALLTDLYQLTMAYGYWKLGRHEHEAVFHMYVRRHPFAGGHMVAAGLEQAIDYLRSLRFDAGDLAYLATLTGHDGTTLFEPAFLDFLAGLAFACDVDAVPEGTVVFANQPLVRVRGPLLQAQLVETALLTIVNFQTLIATKASRVCFAAQGEPVLEFGLRRAQGVDGGLTASRAAYVGGVAATSNVLAGRRYGIPVRGTHAHSWVMSFDDEADAFRRLRRRHAQQLRAAGRHLRHAGRRAQGGRSGRRDEGPRAEAAGRPTRLRRPGLPQHRGPPHPRRRRPDRRRRPGHQRPRRARHRQPQAAGRPCQRLGRRHAAGHGPGPARPRRRLQALGRPRRRRGRWHAGRRVAFPAQSLRDPRQGQLPRRPADPPLLARRHVPGRHGLPRTRRPRPPRPRSSTPKTRPATAPSTRPPAARTCSSPSSAPAAASTTPRPWPTSGSTRSTS